MFAFLKRKPNNPEVTIIYGSHSGNSKFVGREASRILKKHGVKNKCIDIVDFSLKEIDKIKNLHMVISTHGEGEPPHAARYFYDFIHRPDVIDLKHIEYSVCALGDSSYAHYCKTGRDIDERLCYLGGKRLMERVECDVDFGKYAAIWIKNLVGYYKGNSIIDNDEIAVPAGQQKFKALVKARSRLTHPMSDKETCHIELSVTDSDFKYKPGDSVSIVPKNPYALVFEILDTLKRLGDRTLIESENYNYYFSKLLNELEITRLNREVISAYNVYAGNPELESVLKDDSAFGHFTKNMNLSKLLSNYPCQLTAEDLVSMLKKIKPRFYSVASSANKFKNEVHLTVRTLENNYSPGACSNFLNQYLKTGDEIELEVVQSENFQFDFNLDIPIIFVATGTGIAPFMSYLQEIEISNRKRKIWLIFGERNPDYDSLYKNELDNYFLSGVLNSLDRVFSRGKERQYVQHFIKEKEPEIIEWLKSGAVIYVCGSLSMGREVKQEFESILNKTGIGPVKQLVDQKRYFEELF